MIVTEAHELEGLREIGQIVARIREHLKNAAEPGITTKEMDELAGKLFAEYEAKSAPITEYDFPGYTCISVNNEVAHGIPGPRKIQAGDLVNIDVSGVKNGFYGDTGISFVIPGEETAAKQKLCDTAKEAFTAAIGKARAGGKKANIGKAVEAVARRNGYQVIRNLTGHGIGRSLHEEPQYILNYYDPWDSDLLKDGTVLAIEPFISQQSKNVVTSSDNWTFLTPDKSFVAQYEHTIVVTKGTPLILTEWTE